MAASLSHRLGLGNGRAVANARREMLRRHLEEQLVADLVAALALRGLVHGPDDFDGGARRQTESVSSTA